jgi:hypothetical protein
MLAPTLGPWFTKKSMPRLTARLLLFFALVGTFVPLALAVTATSPHACCIRKAAQQCHGSANPESDPPAVRGPRCCSHDCCRAVTTSKSAHPETPLASLHAGPVDRRISDFHGETPATDVVASQSARAPPTVSIA